MLPNTRSVLDCGSPLPLLDPPCGSEQSCLAPAPPYSAPGCQQVAAGILPAVVGGILPPGPKPEGFDLMAMRAEIPPGETPGSTVQGGGTVQRPQIPDFGLWTLDFRLVSSPVLPEVFEAMRPCFCEG
jgi:hypothetical protein